MENSLEQSTLSIVGVLPRWAVGVRTLVCARARVRDRTSAKPCMLIGLWTTFWNQSSGFCHLCVFPNTHRKYQYVWMYMGCVCVLYLYEQCFIFLFVFAKGLSDGFYGSVGKKFKATTTWDPEVHLDSGHKKSKSFNKITESPTKKGNFLEEELFLRGALLSFFHVYMSRESILAEVREAMTQPGFTSAGGFVPL